MCIFCPWRSALRLTGPSDQTLDIPPRCRWAGWSGAVANASSRWCRWYEHFVRRVNDRPRATLPIDLSTLLAPSTRKTDPAPPRRWSPAAGAKIARVVWWWWPRCPRAISSTTDPRNLPKSPCWEDSDLPYVPLHDRASGPTLSNAPLPTTSPGKEVTEPLRPPQAPSFAVKHALVGRPPRVASFILRTFAAGKAKGGGPHPPHLCWCTVAAF